MQISLNFIQIIVTEREDIENLQNMQSTEEENAESQGDKNQNKTEFEPNREDRNETSEFHLRPHRSIKMSERFQEYDLYYTEMNIPNIFETNIQKNGGKPQERNLMH